MSGTILNFQRRFQIWLYTASHGQLLLRSNRSVDHDTRVDILFKDVAAINLSTVIEGVQIGEASEDEMRQCNIALDKEPTHAQKVFMVRSVNYLGYVVARAVFWHEDTGQHFDESYFQKSFLSLRV
jgi:hypothetical protein